MELTMNIEKTSLKDQHKVNLHINHSLSEHICKDLLSADKLEDLELELTNAAETIYKYRQNLI